MSDLLAKRHDISTPVQAGSGIEVQHKSFTSKPAQLDQSISKSNSVSAKRRRIANVRQSSEEHNNAMKVLNYMKDVQKKYHQ